MSSAPVLMTTAQYAAHRKVSDSYVRRLRREGRLVEHAGTRLIDVAATDAHLDATSDPLRGGARATGASAADALPDGNAGTPEPGSLKDAVRRERMARARLAELELGEEARELLRRREVERAVFTLARQALERLRRVPGRLREQLARETDARGCEELLQKEIELICVDLQKGAGKLLDPKVGDGAEVVDP